MFMVIGYGVIYAQPVIIRGKVTDTSNLGLPGASVVIKGTTAGTSTDQNGNYQLEVAQPSTAILLFAFVGYEPMEVEVRGRSVIDVTLVETRIGIDEVVVTALGITREAKALSFSQQSVNVESMTENRSPNLVNALSGKIAGVQVVPSGYNTGSARIVIRGNSSLTGNNQPLFVVDGVPIDNTMGDSGSIDYGNNAADINAEDIESMEVLKGPNASALYGSRAANGVILITTKKGAPKFKVTLNSNTSFQTITELPEYQNAYGVGTSFYIDNTHMLPWANVNYRSWGSPMLGQPYLALNNEVKPYLPQPDNIKSFYQTAHLLTNSFTIEGGNPDNIIRFSYTNYYGNSIVEKINENTRHNLNLRLQNKFLKWLSVDTKVNFIRDYVNNRQYSNDSGRNPTYMYTHMARSTELSELIPWKDPVTGLELGTHRNFSNPYWIIYQNSNEDTKDRIISSISPEIRIKDWLTLIGRVGADIFWTDGYEFNDIGTVRTTNPNGYMRTFNNNQQNINLETILSARKKINEISIVANLGATSFNSRSERRESRINSLLQPGLKNLSNAREYPTVSQNMYRKRLNSLFGSLSLGYRNFAYLDITGRNDWSSTLPVQNNSYFYPSVGGTLILSELFKTESDLLSFAKLRASYAVVGNDTDPYRLDQTFSFTGFFNDATLATLTTTMNNPDLKPEKTTSYEYGADIRFFKNRLGIDATYYNASTVNQIITATIPASSGYERRMYNAGEIRNWGIELSMNGQVIKTKDFKWEANANFARNNSEVVELLEDIPRFQLANRSSYLYVYAEVGKPYANLRGLGVKRDDQGRMLLEPGGGLLEKDTDMEFGTASPDWLAGFSSTFTFKGFDLYGLIDVKKGGVLYSGTISRMLTNGMLAETLYGRDDYYLRTVIWGESSAELSGGARWDAWFADGTPNTKYMSPQSYEYARPNYAEFVIYDASFVKLREISLGYNLPSGLLAGSPVNTARVSLTGRNLYTFHSKTPRGIDPESSSSSGNGQGIENGSLPPNAIYGFNIRLTF